MYNTSWIDVYGTHPWLENFAKIIKSFFEVTGGGGGGLVSHYLKKKSSLRGKILIVQFQKISLLLPSPIHKTVGIYWGWRVLLDQNFERNASSLIGISRGVGGLGKQNPLLGSMDIFWKYTLHRPWENNTYVFYVVKI